MSGDEDDSQKTEDPSQKKLDDARKKGQVAYSREVNHFLLLFALALIVIALAPSLTGQIEHIMMPFIARPHDYVMDAYGVQATISDLLSDVALVMIVPFGLTLVAALVAGGMQTQFNVSLERIKPKLEKISLFKGLKRMFSLKNFVEFLKGIIKISIVGAISFIVVYPYMSTLRLLPAYEISALTGFILSMLSRIIIGVTSIVFIIAIADYLYQRYEFLKNLRMSMQELKDEYKQQEGDPQIKSKLRQIRMQRSRERMMSNVPDADVVITNPTHFAIALKYDTSTMAAPIVLAMGKDNVALKIKSIAEEKRIPVFRNPPVARALFDNATINEEIPLDYYEAVAKIIGYVYKMRGTVAPRTPRK